MQDLSDDLDLLRELNAIRERAKWLRESGLLALKGIKAMSINGVILTADGEQPDPNYRGWIASSNDVEAALLAKVQNHRDMSEDDANNDGAEAAPKIKEKLRSIALGSLFPDVYKTRQLLEEDDEFTIYKVYKRRFRAKTQAEGQALVTTNEFIEGVDPGIPVLVAARVMQALVRRAETVFSRATLICYYRIVSELYAADNPDWVIGAARAHSGGGDASAFVTSECIRAILSFENAILRTISFFRHTSELATNYNDLEGMLQSARVSQGTGHPLSRWADKVIYRMWLDWYISVNPRSGETAIPGLLPDGEWLDEIGMVEVGKYLAGLRGKISEAIDLVEVEIKQAEKRITQFRVEEGLNQPAHSDGGPEGGYTEEDRRRLPLAESADRVAFRAIERGHDEMGRAREILAGSDTPTDELLNKFITRFEEISERIHHILDPAKRYVRNVVNRELANAGTGRFDSGELAFAAAAVGVTAGWKPNEERLKRACELLVKFLPESGSLPTRRPFHSTARGYRLLPIGCEMTRSLAQLLQHTNFEFEPKLASRMLNIFVEKMIPSYPLTGKPKPIGWNFEGAPDPTAPCVWVSAVAVLALDRVVRMLNERINNIILKHFEVIKPDTPHANLRLDSLIYPDYGLSLYLTKKPPLAVRLEQMRAHIMRATLPDKHKPVMRGGAGKLVSVILHGPPGTGKTSLAEALAMSSKVSLIRLSPSDLTVRGQELIEGRARAVFEALSMLTQAVVIFDEFEPVLGSRQPEDKISSATSPVFNFLLTGMLPKLVKLNESARRQSLGYFLATNYIDEVDLAAKRIGRFDLRTPVYQPDPLSRAGAFLQALYRKRPEDRELNLEDPAELKRFLGVVAATARMSAGKLASELPGYARDFYARPDAAGSEIVRPGTGDEGDDEEQTDYAPSKSEKDHMEWLQAWEENLQNLLKGPASGRALLVYALDPTK